MSEQPQQTAAGAGLSPAWRRTIQGGFVVALIAAWYGVTAAGDINPIFLPSPVAVAREAAAIFPTHNFLVDLATTVGSTIAAYAAAVIGGIAAGALVSRSRFAYEVVEPIFSSIFAIPLIIFFPLILLLTGIGPASKIAFAAFYGFFPVALSTMSGFANVERRFVTHAETLGAGHWQMIRRLFIPAAMPQILSGLRISFVITFASVIAGEMIAALAGLGHEITFFSQTMSPAKMFAMIAVVIVLTAIVNAILTGLGRVGERR
jgi:ABC-type nitrate/sulfonate/bicarbonate transport system permease component